MEAERPLSTKEVPKAINTLIIPINPNSVGPKSLARTIEAKKDNPRKTKVSVKVQRIPESVFCFKPTPSFLTAPTYPPISPKSPDWRRFQPRPVHSSAD